MIISQTDDVIKKEEISEITLPYTLVGPPIYTRPSPLSCILLENRLCMQAAYLCKNTNQTGLGHLNTELVCYSDLHCVILCSLRRQHEGGVKRLS